MAKRSANRRLLPQKHTPPPGWKNPLAPQQPLTTPGWLVAAAGATLLLALFCVYITFCLLFWQGQWQLVFHPAKGLTVTPAAAGLRYEEIQFDATETGVLQLHGWWLPAAAPTADTVLLLQDGNGSLSATVPRLQALVPLGMNVFAFDYRGFGRSVARHPSEASTTEDADAAWRYLTDTRHVAASAIVLDGVGLGAAIAAEMARRHPGVRAVILEQPRPPVLDGLQWNAPMRLLPVKLLFHDRFDPRATLAALTVPKLFVYDATEKSGLYYNDAAGPKAMAMLPEGDRSPDYVVRLQAFLSGLRKNDSR
jgi:pimeloyl-ACP methyl ester carboxylesterase